MLVMGSLYTILSLDNLKFVSFWIAKTHDLSTADSAHLILRAPAPAIVTEMAVQPGDRAVNGTPLLTLERIP